MFSLANPGHLTSGGQRERVEAVGTREDEGGLALPDAPFCSGPSRFCGPSAPPWQPLPSSHSCRNRTTQGHVPSVNELPALRKINASFPLPRHPPPCPPPNACLAECTPAAGSRRAVPLLVAGAHIGLCTGTYVS